MDESTHLSSECYHAMADHSDPDLELRRELCLAELPEPETKRWVTRRKAAVVGAVRNGLLSVEEACQRYKLSMEEFATWQQLIEDYGLPGLRATRVQIYRGKGTSSRG